MVYRAMGVMSGSLLDGLDISFAEFQEVSGKWNFEIKASHCFTYQPEWIERLEVVRNLKAFDYQVLHWEYGRLVGDLINHFIESNSLEHQVQLISSLGHAVFHEPSKKMTAQLGEGAAIAAATGINTVTDLRSMDIARGGQGAPIMRIGERLLFPEYGAFLALGTNAAITLGDDTKSGAYDACPVTRVFRLLLRSDVKQTQDDTWDSEEGEVDEKLLGLLNGLDYYGLPYPKSLSPDFGPDVVYALIRNRKLNTRNAVRTYAEHVAIQIRNTAAQVLPDPQGLQLLVTGPGAHHQLLLQRIQFHLHELGIDVIVPDKTFIDHKESTIVALLGILRWREEANTIATVTGGSANSIGGAVWIGQPG